MCGRYALSLRPSQVRRRLNDQNMRADEAPDDNNDRIRQSYNFAPGYHGLIYRAATSDSGAHGQCSEDQDENGDGEPSPKRAKTSHTTAQPVDGRATTETKYKIQAAKWGLVPFWTKRPPDYGSQMRTINCRDDSLMENRGMWNTMKQRKRCIVVAEGFYEWLKKNNGKEKLPHFVKRKDGELMCFAGLWDCVQYEGSEEKLYSYTIITTDSNKQLKFLHDRMPVILNAGSDAMKTWLDPGNAGWSKELQGILKPFDGELECYPVDKAVGKVGNNSPQFIVPLDSKENKSNIANFFGSQESSGKGKAEQEKTRTTPEPSSPNIKQEPHTQDPRPTSPKTEAPESNAPLPKPASPTSSQQIKQETSQISDSTLAQAASELTDENIKRESSVVDDESLLQAAAPGSSKQAGGKGAAPPGNSPEKKNPAAGGRKMRSATSNNTGAKSPVKEGNAKITSFFGK